MAPLPSSVDWDRLSPAAREAVKHVTMRRAAGYSYEEIAEMLERRRPPFQHLQVMPGKAISKAWVAARSRELKHEVEALGATSRSAGRIGGVVRRHNV